MEEIYKILATVDSGGKLIDMQFIDGITGLTILTISL